ncbi:MAG: glycerate kinase, partial [Duodenibacillus sp.]|nr:glycerate kinase [Duodenibacillus sp.]
HPLRGVAGIDACFAVQPGPCTLAEAMEPQAAAERIEGAAFQALRLWACARRP